MNEIETSTIIIILAAGKGTRMQSNLPKVLHPINNKPMLLYVTDVAKTLNPDKIIVVIGYKKELIIKALSNENIIFVEQKNQNGTASAINECIPSIKKFKGNILILSGDVPLITSKTLKEFINSHNQNKALASLISTDLDEPKGYGRIIKNNNNQLINIVEHKDANKNQLKINEINSGIYIIKSKLILEKIPLINNNNMQKEYYLTDIFNFINEKHTSIFKVNDSNEIAGINNVDQLKKLEKSHTE